MKFNKNVNLLLSGQTLANIGDILYIVSVISSIYKHTGSAAMSSIVPFTITTSMFISSLLTPMLIGRMDLKCLLVGSQIGKTMMLAILAFFLISLLNEQTVFIIFPIISVIALLDGCANPIRYSILPYYVKKEDLLQANGVIEAVTQTVQMGMWFAGSLLLISIGEEKLVWIVFGLFSISSYLLARLSQVEQVPTTNSMNWHQISEGWKTLSRMLVLKAMTWIDIFDTLASSVWIAAILYVYVEEVLQQSEQWWGYLNGSFFAGLIAGSIFCVRNSTFVEKHVRLFIVLGSIGSFAATFLFSLTNIPLLILGLSASMGLFGQFKNIPQNTIIQLSVSKETLPKVYSAFGAIETGIFGVSSLLMGILAEYAGVRSAFLLSAFLLAVVCIIVVKNQHKFVLGDMKKGEEG
ncbi:MFS transporter [Metabacillus arenae]|uniref:MFS transporter n=1 Tax=Metabacillus arenae TaxID=2771434 RepID=A0A926NHZ5_9BACI|nr:MFS transporter [Metabacillus arenae]MBD1381135.1 MFS transporter [Metabacillus arenae]